jgi:hypothetical protein
MDGATVLSVLYNIIPRRIEKTQTPSIHRRCNRIYRRRPEEEGKPSAVLLAQ